MNRLVLASTIVMLSNNAFGTVLIQNNFDGVADDIGPGFQLLDNDSGNGNAGLTGTFDPATGAVFTGTATGTPGNTGATGINNVALVSSIPAGTTAFTVVYDIASVANVSTIRSNGLFLGIITGTDANVTGTTGAALFNNDASASLGFRLLGGGATTIVRDGTTGGTEVLETLA